MAMQVHDDIAIEGSQRMIRKVPHLEEVDDVVGALLELLMPGSA